MNRRTFLPALAILLFTALKAQEKLSPKTFHKQLAATPGAILLDVRTPKEVARSYIKNAVFLNFHDTAFNAMLSRLDSTKPLFVYCAIGVRSHDAAVMLQRKGFQKVYDLKGGIINWRLAGLPVVKGKDYDSRTGISKTGFLESLKDKPLVLVDFFAPWCAPCQVMVPALDSMKTAMKDTAVIITMNADENLRLMKEMNFNTLPYIMVLQNGRVVHRQDGFMSRGEMEMLVRKFYTAELNN